MEKKTFSILVACCIALAAVLAFATIRSMGGGKPASNASVQDKKNDKKPETGTKPVKEGKKPASERRHGPKAHKKVDLAKSFASMGENKSGEESEGEQQKELYDQTPEEAVEFAWQGLETYREMSDEEKLQAQFAMILITGIVDGLAANPQEFLKDMDEQQRAEAVEKARAVIANIDAIEQEVSPDMSEDELKVIGGTLESVRKLSRTVINTAQ